MNVAIAQTICRGTRPNIAGRKTFISAFESLPVHCLNPHPLGKQQRPGNSGAAAILRIGRKKIVTWYLKDAHCWSSSAIFFFASAPVLFCLIYCSTHATRWSLNVPLISWWRTSGVIISCMSAWGNWNKNGYEKNQLNLENKQVGHTP